jgi:TIR domain
MQIAIAAASGKSAIDLIRPCLEAAGHAVTIGFSEPGDRAAVAIAVVHADIEPADVVQMWAELAEAQEQGLPIVAATMMAVSDIPAAVAALPRAGDWIRVDPTQDPGCHELLGAITAVGRSAVDAAPGAPKYAGTLAKVRSNATRLRQFLPKQASGHTAEGETAHRKRIFVAYSREDSVIVHSIVGRLERAGYDVWLDTKSIPGGTRWRDRIGQAISEHDLVLLVLSSNVIKKPHYQQAEIDLADAHQKTIIPVLIDKIPMPPRGFEVILSGVEYISLYDSFENGIARLLAALGDEPGTRKRGPRELARDKLTEVRDAARRNELGEKAKTAAVVGLGVTAALAIKALAQQKEQERARESAAKAQQARAKQAYVEETVGLVSRIMQEIELTNSMTPQAYREEFKDNVLEVLGELKGRKPPDPDLTEAHARVVKDLSEVLIECDKAVSQFERGDADAWNRALTRLNKTWATSLQSSVDWLLQATGTNNEEPGNITPE